MVGNKIDRKKVERLVKQEKEDKEIAEQLNCSASTIQHIRLNELGIQKSKKHKRVSKNIIEFLRMLLRKQYVLQKNIEKLESGTILMCYRKLVHWGFPIFRKQIMVKGRKTNMYYIDRSRVHQVDKNPIESGEN